MAVLSFPPLTLVDDATPETAADGGAGCAEGSTSKPDHPVEFVPSPVSWKNPEKISPPLTAKG